MIGRPDAALSKEEPEPPMIERPDVALPREGPGEKVVIQVPGVGIRCRIVQKPARGRLNVREVKCSKYRSKRRN